MAIGLGGSGAIGPLTPGSMLKQGLNGMQQSQREMLKAADTIAKAGTVAGGADSARDTGRDITESLVEMKMQQQVFDASAKVVKTADETLGTLLDTSA